MTKSYPKYPTRNFDCKKTSKMYLIFRAFPVDGNVPLSGTASAGTVMSKHGSLKNRESALIRQIASLLKSCNHVVVQLDALKCLCGVL